MWIDCKHNISNEMWQTQWVSAFDFCLLLISVYLIIYLLIRI